MEKEQIFINDMIRQTEEQMLVNTWEIPYIIAFVGNSGSGKSTVSKILSNYTGASVLNADEIRYHIISKLGYSMEENERKVQDLTDYIYQKRLSILLAHNVSVIRDRNLYSFHKLDLLKNLTENVILIKIETSEEERRKRIENRKNQSIEECFYSLVNTKQRYEEVKRYTTFEIENIQFNYIVNATKGIPQMEQELKRIALEINKKYGRGIKIGNSNY